MTSSNDKMGLYDTYPHNERHMKEYVAYQQRYVTTVRESDRVILRLIAEVLDRNQPSAEGVELLDIGCSTGNLLRHIRAAFPSLKLVGGDLSDLQLELCRKDADLQGISFARLDLKALPADERYDVIVANAILYGFDQESFEVCIRSISGALKPGGTLIAFDFFHPWKQEVAIIERTRTFPEGHPLHFRPYGTTEKVLRAAGFGDIAFQPFRIPIDLPEHSVESESIRTHTVSTTTGERLLFRGAICQPWCHLVATRSSHA